MFKKKKGISTNMLIAIIFIIVAGLLTILVFSLNKKEDDKSIEQKVKTEEEKLLDVNKEAIEKAQKQTIGQVRAINKDDHILGQLDAPIQFIIYSDFECPFCAQFTDTVGQVREEFGDEVAVAFRHFPLTTIHYNAMTAAIASECADEQGKFWEMHDKIFNDNIANKLNTAQFKDDAKEIGLELTKFNKCLDTEKYKEKIETQMLEGKNAGITGTPGSFVNEQHLPGAYPFEDFTDSQGFERMGMKSIIERHLNME